MTKTINSKILLRRDTSTNWSNNNPILSAGEIGFDTSVGKHKIGDGTTPWNDLPYFALVSDTIYILPEATANTLGGVKVGTNLNIDANGVLSATDTTYTAASPITLNGTEIQHEASGVTAGSYGQTTAQTPEFGGTFSVPSATVDTEGHVTAMAAHNVTIPNAEATTTSAGLMSAADKTKINALGNIANLTYTVVSTW